MARNIIGVIVGYIAMALFVFVTFTILYLLLGADGAFESGSYDVSNTWLVFSLLLSIIAALLGGFVCILISKNKKAVMALAGIVLILGLIMAIPALTAPDSDEMLVRDGNVDNMDAMQNAKQPPWVSIINPILGAACVYLGGSLRKESKT